MQDAGLGENDWLCIVGVDCDTRVRLRIAMENETVTFKINSDDRLNGWSKEGAADRILTGDGTVPYLGALSSFIPIEKVVCVTPADYGYWEIQDRALTKLSGFHGIMPNMNMLHRLIVRYFTGRDDPHGNTWGRRPPNIPEGRDWNPPLALREKT